MSWYTLRWSSIIDKTIGNTAVGVLAHTVHYLYTLPPHLLRSWRWRTKDSHASIKLRRAVAKVLFLDGGFCCSLFSCKWPNRWQWWRYVCLTIFSLSTEEKNTNLLPPLQYQCMVEATASCCPKTNANKTKNDPAIGAPPPKTKNIDIASIQNDIILQLPINPTIQRSQRQ